MTEDNAKDRAAAAEAARIQKAIFAAIVGAYGDTKDISLNNVLSALGAAEARFIAGIPDRNIRQSTIKSLNALRDRMIGEYLKLGGGPRVHTVIMQGAAN